MTEINWQPSASIEILKKRAQLMDTIRGFFKQRDYLEVETPIMSQYGITDIYLANIKAIFRNQSYFLQTSPEYHMKRLLAAGSGSIYQLIRVFRDDELGRWHNPEFTMLEWYRLGFDHHQLMDEVDALLQAVMQTKPIVKKTYEQAFRETCDLNPFTASIDDFKRVLKHHELDYVLPADETDRDQYLFLLMSHVVEPALGKLDAPTAVYGFPPSQAALAQIHDGCSDRFEVYYKGVELANGFHELTDAKEQALRFENDRETRAQKGLPEPEIDPFLLKALNHGIPACSGVALGVDRLLALALGQDSLAKIMSFDFSRA